VRIGTTWPFVRVNVNMSSSIGSTHVTSVTTSRLSSRPERGDFTRWGRECRVQVVDFG
jgi:hypothetical protein